MIFLGGVDSFLIAFSPRLAFVFYNTYAALADEVVDKKRAQPEELPSI